MKRCIKWYHPYRLIIEVYLLEKLICSLQIHLRPFLLLDLHSLRSPACPGEECVLCHHSARGRFPDLKEEKEILENPHVLLCVSIHLGIYLRYSAPLRRSGCCWGSHAQDLNFSYLNSTSCVKALLLATVEDPRWLWSLWGQLHDLTVTPCQNKTWLYTSFSPPSLLHSAVVPTGRKPRHRDQRGGTLWPSSWFGWAGDQDNAAHCLAQPRHSLEDYKAIGWSWSTRNSRHVICTSPLPRLIGEEKLLSFLNSAEFLQNPSPFGTVWPFTQLRKEPRAEMQVNTGLDCEMSTDRLQQGIAWQLSKA